MKKLIAITIISLSSNLLSAMEVTLATSKVIKDRLIAAGMPQRAIEGLKIDTAFGEKTVNPTTIQSTLEKTFNSYTDSLSDLDQRERMKQHINQHMPTVVATILQDHPEAIEHLKNQNLLP